MTLEIAADELNRLLSLPECAKKSRKRKRDETPTNLKNKHRKVKKEKKKILKTLKPKVEQAVPSDTPLPSINISDEIRKRIAHRNSCTVRVSGLPLKCNPSIIYDLAPEAQAYRIHWNDRIHGCDGIVFLEFSSASLAESYKDKLNNSQCMKKRITAVTGKFLSEEIDEYDCCKLMLQGLHWKTRVVDLARRFPASCNIKMRPMNERLKNRKPEQAILTFPSPEAALQAFDTRQGVVIRRRKTSVLWFRKKTDVDNQANAPKKILLVSGIRKSVSEADIQAVYPQATSITINRVSGEAVLDYDLEEDCLLDWKNAHGVVLHGRKLKAYPKRWCKFAKKPVKSDESHKATDQCNQNASISRIKIDSKELGSTRPWKMVMKKKNAKMNRKSKNSIDSVLNKSEVTSENQLTQ